MTVGKIHINLTVCLFLIQLAMFCFFFNQVKLFELPRGVICLARSKSAGEICISSHRWIFLLKDEYKRYQIKQLVKMDFFFFPYSAVAS